MTQRPTTSPTSSHLPPLLLWLALQLLVLLLPVFQIRLSDDFPRPAERLAIQEMLLLQTTAAGLLFPCLLPTLATTLILIAAAWPFILLAGILSSTPPLPLLFAGAYLSTWLLLLGLWQQILSSPKQRLTACALATALTLGGPLLGYLQAEFRLIEPSHPALLGPLPALFSLLQPTPVSPQPWLPLALALLATAALALALAHRRRNARP